MRWHQFNRRHANHVWKRHAPCTRNVKNATKHWDRKITIYDRLLLQQYCTVKLRYQIPSKLSTTCSCIQTTRFGQQQRTTVYIYYTKCVCWVYLITSISRESGKLQKSRHVLATRRCCHAIEAPEGIVVVPTLENHLHVYSIFSGIDSRLRLGFMLHPRALCKLEKKTVVLQVLFFF